MSETSIGKEVLEMAVEIERNGNHFYESLARLSKGSGAWDTYTFLAAQELAHANTFREMLSRLGGYRPRQAHPGEHYQYIKDLADSAVFAGEKAQAALAQEAMSDAQALETGISFEKDSILLYSEMRSLVPPADRGILDRVISEERHHLRMLTDLKSQRKA